MLQTTRGIFLGMLTLDVELKLIEKMEEDVGQSQRAKAGAQNICTQGDLSGSSQDGMQ